MQPPPPNWDLGSLQEEAAGQEEECGGRDHDRVASDVAGNKGTNQHNISICGDKRDIDNHPEIEEAAFELEQVVGYGSECEALDSKEGQVDNQCGNHVRRGSVCIVGLLTDEDVALLNEHWNRIVGGEEDQADSKNVEVEELVDIFEGISTHFLEER